MKRSDPNKVLEAALESLRQVPPPDEARQLAARRAFLIRARHLRPARPVTGPQDGRRKWMKRSHGVSSTFYLERSFRMIAAIVAAILAALAATGGVAYASDGAAPGDPLYGIDQLVEQVQLGLTSDSQKAVELGLSFADERLLEAEEVAEEGSEEELDEAIRNYGQAVSTIAQALSSGEELDYDALSGELNMVLARHEHQFRHIFRLMEQAELDTDDDDADTDDDDADTDDDDADTDDEDADTDDDEGDGDFCVGADPHPVAARLAEAYEGVEYEDIMGWFCEGRFGFGEIMIALSTSERLNSSGDDDADNDNGADDDDGSQDTIDVEDLFAMRASGLGWGQIRQSLGLIGHGAKNDQEELTEVDDDDGDVGDDTGDDNGEGEETAGDATQEPEDERPGNAVGRENAPGQQGDKPGNGNNRGQGDNDTDDDDAESTEEEGSSQGQGRGNAPGQQGTNPGNGVGRGNNPNLTPVPTPEEDLMPQAEHPGDRGNRGNENGNANGKNK